MAILMRTGVFLAEICVCAQGPDVEKLGIHLLHMAKQAEGKISLTTVARLGLKVFSIAQESISLRPPRFYIMRCIFVNSQAH
jgi:hypothetical protein